MQDTHNVKVLGSSPGEPTNLLSMPKERLDFSAFSMGKMWEIFWFFSIAGIFTFLCVFTFCNEAFYSPKHIFTREGYDNLDYGIPGACNQLINREGYALGYNEDWEQAAWVMYRLTEAEVLSRECDRGDYFCPDPEITTGSSTTEDYWRSGYDRGHLAPAADMRWSLKAMKESFFMSNMSPQVPDFNRKMWKSVEDYVREMAKQEKSVFVVTGPVFFSGVVTNRIGRSRVAVPHAFFKVIYDETPPQRIEAYLVPNCITNAPVSSFAVPVDKIERLTGLKFFPRQEPE